MAMSVATQKKGYVFQVADSFSDSKRQDLGELPTYLGKYCAMVCAYDGLRVMADGLYNDEEFFMLQIAIHLCTEELTIMKSEAYSYSGKTLRSFQWQDEFKRMQANAPRNW